MSVWSQKQKHGELPIEWKLLLVLREAVTAVMPYRAVPPRVVCYYFKRADPNQVAGQYHPKHRIEVCAIVKEESETGKEVNRSTSIFDAEDKVAEAIRLTGYVAPDDVVLDGTSTYPYFAGLQFFNNVVPRPAWLDEKIQQEGV